MNTPAEHDPELRCAEYALGLLDADEREALKEAADADPALAATLARWQEHFAPLAEDLERIAVPNRVWARIQRDLGFFSARGSAVESTPRRSRWNSLALWRVVGIGASVATIALVTVEVISLREPARPPSVTVAPATSYMVATIARPDGVAHWTATVDVRRREMIVVPTVKSNLAVDRATELWLIAPNSKPVSLGVFTADTPARVTLSERIVAQLTAHAVLAVSLEPAGGSATGQPTGPVIATGQIRGAV